MQKFGVMVILTAFISGCNSTSWLTMGQEKPSNVQDISQQQMLDGNLVYVETPRVDVLGEKTDKQNINTFLNDTHFQPQGSSIRQYDDQFVGANWNKKVHQPVAKNVNHFVRGIMHQLINNIHYVNDKTPIGVTNFVFLDGSYTKASLLSNQIAESFMHEVHQFGIPVIDFKTTDFVRVTAEGDFVLSRDFLELRDNLPIKYVLAGTLVKHKSGYLVNARIVGITSKAVVASAQGFIPNKIADAIVPSRHNDGIILSQGE